ncbi:hypothetical protein B0F90DRAFT_1683521 [Multifurca ochricompacta]|uniref:GAR domain-containing protein n=1 Tax=Multifurca ochricompacta TaxID=376703 RepID=A0AAD4MD72_9AGAM|nr:hypothetical protein B0F90DRAFT_1683521 [Multifurca ochricompacta]
MSNSSEDSRLMEATGEDPNPPQAEAAGPLGHMNHDPFEPLLTSRRFSSRNPGEGEVSESEQNGEQALESHEVMELQAFSERKDWILEKIKLLESLSSIEPFADLDAVHASTAAISGLPTRSQLELWLIEHDKIEKETELFDSGELKKFKKFTKAASKRNLSSQDTDIIELTLTTICEFDKLLHLLRDRSENLDLLSIRLTWEELRYAAWADHRQLLLDLQKFLFQRARWSPSVYDTLPHPQAEGSGPTLSRRGSIASMTSEASNSSTSGVSRGARFKQAEALSREAAQFAGPLDKLIENSRRAVPEEILDEQDRLEEHGISEMENVGRFIMSVVTQWRKADEFYVETMKDQASAQSLVDDIESAQLSHPSSRQDSVFSARASTIIKRLSSRDNPSSAASGFLRPTHALFSDQPTANESIIKVLSEELEIGLSLARRLERNAFEYHTSCEAVRKAEHSITCANELSNSYDYVLHQMLNGVESSDGDGTPPDLTLDSCLRETKHAAFLALLPSLVQQLDKSDEEARNILPGARASLLSLSDISVEPEFQDRLLSAIRRLEDVKVESERIRAIMTERVSALRDARKIWVSAGSILKELGTIRAEMGDFMEQQSHLPPTPESFNASLPLSNKTLENASEQVSLLHASFVQNVQAGISVLPAAVDSSLRMYLVKRHEGLLAILEHTQQMIQLAEDTESRIEVLAEQILGESSSDDILDSLRLDLASDVASIQTACKAFMDNLPHHATSSNSSSLDLRRRFTSSLDLTLDALQSLPPLGPPIDLSHLDHVVRTDCNAFALRLAADVSSLQQKIANLDVVQDAHAVDLKLVTLRKAISIADESLEVLREAVDTVPDTFDSIPSPVFDAHRSEISRSLSPIRQALHKMDVLLSDIRRREERLRVAQQELEERKRLKAEAVEKLRRDQDEAEAKQREEEERAKVEREREVEEVAERLRRVQAEERMKAELERAVEAARMETDVPSSHEFPIFADHILASEDGLDKINSSQRSNDLAEVQSHVAELRRRLRSLRINDAARPSSSSVSPLPTVEQYAKMASQLKELPTHASNFAIDAELKSLQDELEASHLLLPRAHSLAQFGSSVQDCDNALSDLLEHIDSYPAPPCGPLSASYVSPNTLPPEEQLGDRLTFMKNLIDTLEEGFSHVMDEPRASSEQQRIAQTWAELESMASDRINGRKSRPASTMSSGRNSRASVGSHHPILKKKSSHYSSLSASTSSRGRGHALAPAHPSTSARRIPHNADPIPTRSLSRLSVVSSNRSVSGPMGSSSRLFNSTFSSRQRTISLSSASSSPISNNPSQSSLEPSHPHPPHPPHQGRTRRVASPTPSDSSGFSRSFSSASRAHPTWGRPPRLSFPSSNPFKSPPKSKPPRPLPRKPYVANPKSKLDVAVGDVVNKLPVDVDIKVEVAQDTWQDRSGKYWIGSEDPKLCFCRILRSHAVMVRVGGGWMELSKFIQTHFADMFRLFPEPMPYLGSREEKWISSSALLEAPELITPPRARAPKTPEPGSGGVLLPSFALSTPSGRSPQSIKTHSSPGSPLTALQFLRRVDEDSFLRPSTPTKGSLLRNHGHGKASLPLAPMRSPNRVPVWKP